MRRAVPILLGTVLWAAAVAAQTAPDAGSLQGVRTDLARLQAQIARLREELRTADPQVTGVVNPAPLLERTDALEEDLRRLTAQVDALQVRLTETLDDMENRLGDLAFRVEELEGGGLPPPAGAPAPQEGGAGTSEPAPLGAVRPRVRSDPAQGGAGAAGVPPRTPLPEADSPGPAAAADPEPEGGEPADSARAAPPPDAPAAGDDAPPGPPLTAPLADTGDTEAPQLALTEERAFDAALAAHRDGRHARAALDFEQFLADFPGGPLTDEAAFWLGEARAAQDDWAGAARAYLDSFSGAPQGSKAPDALHRLGVALGRLGRTGEACLTLAEVPARYPQAPAELLQRAREDARALGCG